MDDETVRSKFDSLFKDHATLITLELVLLQIDRRISDQIKKIDARKFKQSKKRRHEPNDI